MKLPRIALPLVLAAGAALAAAPDPPRPPAAAQEPLVGGPYPALLLPQAWFWRNEANKVTPGPARLQIWRQLPGGWQATRLEDPGSNVFHKALFVDGGVLTFGGTDARLVKWTPTADGWRSEVWWSREWGGKFNRLRDVAVGDVDGDGRDELVIATHDQGVIAVLDPPLSPGAAPAVVELGQRAETFVHEVEIGDIDGDGEEELFAAISRRGSGSYEYDGEVVMYRWDGSEYVRSVVESFEKRHAKEILAADLDGSGAAELLGVVEAEVERGAIVKPVEIRQYTLNNDGTFTGRPLATLDDRQTRFLVPGDFDFDGDVDLVAAAMKSGLWLLRSDGEGAWTKVSIDPISGGFEHACAAGDLDGSGGPELYVAADDQQELRRYTWNPQTRAFDRALIGRFPDNTLTWDVVIGAL